MSSYFLGNLLGRLIVSYFIVWLIVFVLFTQLDWRKAFKRTHKWYGLLGVVVLFVAGIASSMAGKGGF